MSISCLIYYLCQVSYWQNGVWVHITILSMSVLVLLVSMHVKAMHTGTKHYTVMEAANSASY